jgi:hypothetical protein
MTRNMYGIILWLFCIISPFTLIPFERAVIRFAGAQPVSMTFSMLAVMAIEAIIIYGIFVFFGMRWAERLGIRFLLLEKNSDFKNDIVKPGLVAGAVCALAVLLLDALLPSSPYNLFALAQSISPVVGFLSLFVCIVNQDVFVCLFCISGIAILLKKICHELTISTGMIISILISSLIFGIAHMPLFIHTTASNIPLLVTRLIALNIVAGTTFGMLFWKKSFETAVFAHVVVDFVLYVLVPLGSMFVR